MSPRRWATAAMEAAELPLMAVGATYRLLSLEVVYQGVDATGEVHRFVHGDRLELVADAFLTELRASGLLTVVEGK